MAKYASEANLNPNIAYQLDSFICQVGSLNEGHYYAYQLVDGKSWFKCNDSIITPIITKEDIEELYEDISNVYLAFYRREGEV